MGLTEALVERASAKSALILVPGLLLAYVIVAVVVRPAWQEIKLARMPGTRAPRIKSKLPFGLDFLWGSVTSAQKNQNLAFWNKMLGEAGAYTVEGRIAGRRIVFTADHENIKAILATQFNDYGKGEPFHQEWRAFLGDSIFTTDGALWHDSRQLIRPQFIRDRVSDLHVFEKHMRILFRAIANGGALDGENQPVDIDAGNGKPVEISDLFFRFTLDSATEFLLGHDVKSLRRQTAKKKKKKKKKNVRLALRDTTLPRGGGPDGLEPVKVLKDTPIAYSTLVMQRREDLYPPPGAGAGAGAASAPADAFSPDRWATWQPRPWQYIPFNGGPRICIGQQFALTEMAYVLTRLFQRYDRIDNYTHRHPGLKADIVLQPAEGVRVGLWEARTEK
ncbi:cytochrome P450 [Thermothelomyces heterothallicus CBS 203.75]